MASILSGIEFDIFIGYLQMDNKDGRRMSEFFDALSSEFLRLQEAKKPDCSQKNK